MRVIKSAVFDPCLAYEGRGRLYLVLIYKSRLMYNNMIIIRTRQISPTIIVRPKRITLVIEYEYTEQIQQWYRFCQQQIISYLAYRTILPSFTAPGQFFSINF